MIIILKDLVKVVTILEKLVKVTKIEYLSLVTILEGLVIVTRTY